MTDSSYRRTDGRLGAVPALVPVAVRGTQGSDIGPGRYRGAIFAGSNPFSQMVWLSLRTRSRTGPAIKNAAAAVSDVRRGFEFGVSRAEKARAGLHEELAS